MSKHLALAAALALLEHGEDTPTDGVDAEQRT